MALRHSVPLDGASGGADVLRQAPRSQSEAEPREIILLQRGENTEKSFLFFKRGNRQGEMAKWVFADHDDVLLPLQRRQQEARPGARVLGSRLQLRQPRPAFMIVLFYLCALII